MKNFLITIVCAIVFLHAQLALAQQQPTYTHYMYNMQSYNPAYVGSRKAISGVGLYRTQWVGYEGAPVTQTICMSAPINKDRLGIGLSFNNDKIGPMKATSAVVDFAYHLPVSKTGKLAFGIKAGVNIISSNLSSIKLDDPNDFSFQANVNSKATPNVGFGLYYYAAKFYAGLSAPQLVAKSIKATENGNTVDFYTPKKHFYGTIGFVTALNGSLDLKPTMLLKLVMGAPVQLDLTTTLIYKKIMHAGIMYRSGESVGALIGFTFNNSCMLGYSYDWTILNKTNTYHYGSHELIIRFDLALKKNTKGAFLGYF